MSLVTETNLDQVYWFITSVGTERLSRIATAFHIAQQLHNAGVAVDIHFSWHPRKDPDRDISGGVTTPITGLMEFNDTVELVECMRAASLMLKGSVEDEDATSG